MSRAIGAVPVLALVPPLPLAVIVATSAAFGIAIVFGNTLWETALQQEVRPDRLARVGSIDWLLSLCLMPAGQALAGPLVGPLGVRGTLILAAAPMSVPNLCVLAFVREVRRVRRRDAPDPAPAQPREAAYSSATRFGTVKAQASSTSSRISSASILSRRTWTQWYRRSDSPGSEYF